MNPNQQRSEFAVCFAPGSDDDLKGLAELRSQIAETSAEVLPGAATHALELLGNEVDRIAARLAQIDKTLIAQHKTNPQSRRLAEIPGVGPMSALNFSLRVDASQFRSGRHFAAWLGLVPKEHSTGGKQRLGAISRAGDERLRQLLVLGATAVIRYAKPDRPGVSAWLIALLGRKPRKLAAVALANKMARIIWAMLTRGEAYRRPASVSG
jgi:transposase